MARGLNKVMLIGRLGKDPETKYTQGGMAVASFSMATSEEWMDKATNEKKEKTEWHRIICFGKLAEICGKYLTKGKQIYVEGRLQTRSWEQDGVPRYVTEVVVSDMQMLGGKPDGQHEPANNSQYSQPAQGQQSPPPGGFDDDIPF